MFLMLMVPWSVAIAVGSVLIGTVLGVHVVDECSDLTMAAPPGCFLVERLLCWEQLLVLVMWVN